jgi:4-aminobutyrate aminotransferase-like enzyme
LNAVSLSTQDILNTLRTYESRNITFIDPDGSWPIVWQRARGVHVWDLAGKKYLDLTAAFGVAAAGHANPRVVQAGRKQMGTLLHAMGDVHPHPLKALLARELSRITFERWATPIPPSHPHFEREQKSRLSGKVILCNSGFEAVEAALKTALLATGKPGVIAFQRGYHGLGYGALNATSREHFRSPFQSQLAGFGHFLPFPALPDEWPELEANLESLFEKEKIGAILVEPIQVRGGIHVPPPQFLRQLRDTAHRHGALLILDEIYTGFGRTGRWFACEHAQVLPDLICLGKALTGGFPLSACIGRADLMDAAWPASTGEAIHTSTYLGHPVGCAMALVQIQEIDRRNLVERSAHLGTYLLNLLSEMSIPPGICVSIRGQGLLAGIEIRDEKNQPATEVAVNAIKKILGRGFILLPEGEHSEVISLTPPLIISETQLARTVRALQLALFQSLTNLKEARNFP